MDRVSEIQLQVGENSDWIIWRLKGLLGILVIAGMDKQEIRFELYKMLDTYDLTAY